MSQNALELAVAPSSAKEAGYSINDIPGVGEQEKLVYGKC